MTGTAYAAGRGGRARLDLSDVEKRTLFAKRRALAHRVSPAGKLYLSDPEEGIP
jgi:hypothetical protein